MGKILSRRPEEVLVVHSRYTLRKPEEVLITPEASPFIKITLENSFLESDVIHVTRKDTMLENVLETKMSLTRRKETGEDIMLMLKRMMNLQQREPDMKVKILQVMKNMF